MTTKTDLREFTKDELVALLTSDVAGWNRLYEEARRASDYEWYADLRNANLRYADLGNAELRNANLWNADLWNADLGNANLGNANLGNANLGNANLWNANLRYANLGNADLTWSDPLWPFRADTFDILDAAPGEVATLREQIVAGNIDGSVYEGECACLCGTIANAQGVSYDAIEGVKPDSSRPAERWFAPIRKGDEPVSPIPDGDVDWSSEGVYRASVALVWVDEWIASRTRIAEVIA
jgi:hypothetical protein